EIMGKFRDNAPEKFDGLEILLTEDFKELTATSHSGKVEKLTTPPSDVLKYHLEDGSWIAVRPSGTEPKIKFYMAAVADTEEQAQSKIDHFEKEITTFIG